jgi:2',3'-cyclic-nucleotide 2'-phosphodiesterase (5'-nucleotidase family)
MSDGREFDPAASYRLVMSDFMASGGDGLQVSEGADRVEALGIVDLDALIAWLRAQPSPVRPPTDRRIVSRSP